MGTRIPTVPYSTPKLDALLERDAAVGGRPPSDDATARRARMKRGTSEPIAAHPLIYAAAAGGVALVFAASLGGSKATRIAALAAVGIGAVTFVIARRPLRLASLLEQATAEVLGAP
jgi:hypothetical protein